MKINRADFVISAVKPDQWPKDGLPEIALAGRSNVGKSSLINTLLNRKNLARTSQRPGKTQTLNYFIINESFYFVDVPGYGYAKVSQAERKAWIRMIETYLTKNQQLRVVVQLVDLRHAPSAEDVQMYQFLKHYGIPVIIVTTKADKISRGQYQKHLKVVRETLNKDPEDPIVLFSSFKGLGKDELWQAIQPYLGS
ncbi:ribosome biogenesis GTP-binding protein YihA/YsxC [Pullulanibacillus sp. KACC 23026]|uniref:ribosome biogenesis GTP-binding protein YihA/YsxC n=1 Tax=Pullulanibacillus sp. KACC 23026 TaxID=3028315 RepID=UPI0023B13C31|nr:ribosome biogenesis GTP-binding protein YihA/YsxC [Pullulanibacillus sp. KACC 23026]WEG14034.1 ribosome biogenesis GTP-binding protein YihA/YsxC [Pullulanibacillus sp. KACC 23026]